MGQEHPVPATEGVVGERCCVVRIDVDHHRGDALLPGPHGCAVNGQTELTAQGGLHARAVKDLAFDRTCAHRFLGQKLNAQPVSLFPRNMTHCAEDLAG